ncbi:MAG: response regulator transcription factor [Bacteroidetes bacterium]|nr:response regulator transcription factor [Bacteroidota bacterium]
MQRIRVLVFEDNFKLRESLYFLINSEEDLECCGTYPDCKSLEKVIEETKPDVILMDIEMPGISGIEAARIIKSKFPGLPVLMQTVFHDDSHIFNAICAGASGYLLKSSSSEAYAQAIRDVFNGGSPMSGPVARRVLELFQKNVIPSETKDYDLTQKEKEVLAWLIEGKSFKQIAASIGISYETVRSHMKNIYSKLHVHSNTEAVIKALKEKLV